jgi:prephenate dehydrogenase
MKPSSITIIGLGLIGGSLARALREKLGIRGITAVDPDAKALEAARNEGIIKEGFTGLDSSIYASDIIFVCTPVKQTMEYIGRLAPEIAKTCILTDVCSTKGEIARFVETLAEPPLFIGGHPMAGTEKSGYANSFAHLFENAYYVLTPCSTTTRDAMDVLNGIVEGIGAIPIVMEAEEHDRATGGISHLPHVIASSLVNLVKELDDGSGIMQTLAAGGFRDITRIASSSPAMWANIVSSNKTQLLELTGLFTEKLKQFGAAVENGNSEAIYRFFEEARQFRDSLSAQATGLIRPVNRLIVDVEDKPGIIGEIATILGKSNINIKNIHVANSRESEQGCLTIALPDSASVNIAFDLLVDTGYKVYKTK